MSQYQKSEKTKKTILNCASKLFFEKGYTATTVREIASQTGLSVNRLNYHFHNKSEVAALICQRFLKSINDQVYRITFPLTDNLILKDIVHIRLIIKAFLHANRITTFYYEIACEHIISEVIGETAPYRFREQIDYLGLDIDDDTIQAYSKIFVAALVELIKADYTGDLNLDEIEFLDIYNSLHLKMLDQEKETRITLLDKAKQLVNNMNFEMRDISNVVVKIHN